ncbi:hypothetical protein BRADI_2g44065v3 [Brachypodium distachyon]|uniref:Uncharacterized protein n=1 Tax=Brachypodium distachyon TaxID=15368 RepID=A0A0Q3GED8_BRADI|nr:hypothetical protein BRADI_2g44065v3 [Brachypodium distachyon]KQK08814.1 hypothetical protein BRADI_2g44065v3 [Brachypodium distachyon]KQK08815.1 hypothetical protein BRADI_2g44065v3 [Brachypodium distachyon]
MAGPARTAARHRTKSAEAGVVRHHTVCWTPTPAHVYIYTPASIGSKGGEARAAAGTHGVHVLGWFILFPWGWVIR